jgi:hypothetical protein
VLSSWQDNDSCSFGKYFTKLSLKYFGDKVVYSMQLLSKIFALRKEITTTTFLILWKYYTKESTSERDNEHKWKEFVQ